MRMPPSHPCPRVPQLLASLLLLAGSAATQPQQVNVLLGDSVLLSPTLLPNMTVTKTEWSFSAGTGATILVAESISGGFMRPNPQDRFGKRLTMPNATALRIEALEVGDRGVYEARINLPLALVEEQTFNLFVYEPVPPPEIQHQVFSLTTRGCNVTLRCWVPGGHGAEATWHPDTSETPWTQPCEDSQSLCLVVPPSAFNSSFTCLARNPIQERRVSIHLGTLCLSPEISGWWRWHLCYLLLPVVAGASLGLGLWSRKKRKAARGGTFPAHPPQEALCRQIQRRSPQEHNLLTTIYSQQDRDRRTPPRDQ
ncbi:SLAM family member 8-like isoform X2 [Heliangelus exortis]|uniref:SLAM family member 8-like isoform X2 n=1 Tax=Heliangelus exortis TaxID=472823 RepID=UPI003A8D0EB3